MPVVRIDLRQPTDGGVPAGTGGTVVCEPTRRRTLDTEHHPIVVKRAFEISLVDGVASPTLATTDGTWCWKITEPDGTVRHIAVGAVDVDYADCPDVDPATLSPLAEPEAAWWIALEAATLGGGGWSPVDASTTVKGIVELATTAETQTGTDATRAVTPAGLAVVIGAIGSLNGLGVAIWSPSTGWPARPTCTICFWIGTQSASAGYPSEATDYDVVFQHPDAP